jgi:hypothetical protein
LLVCFFIFAREAAGAWRARHSLRPPISRAGRQGNNSRASRGEIAKLWLLESAVASSFETRGTPRVSNHEAMVCAVTFDLTTAV